MEHNNDNFENDDRFTTRDLEEIDEILNNPSFSQEPAPEETPEETEPLKTEPEPEKPKPTPVASAPKKEKKTPLRRGLPHKKKGLPKRKVDHSWKKTATIVVSVLVFLALVGVGGVFLLYTANFTDISGTKYTPKEKTEVYTSDGVQIASIF